MYVRVIPISLIFCVLQNVASQKDVGWALEYILHLEVNINKYTPLHGSSFIPLPKFIQYKKAVVNVQNNDQQCFLWAVVSALFPKLDQSTETSSYPHPSTVLNTTGDSCQITPGAPGTCRMLTDCAYAIDNIKIGKFPVICGFVGTQSIVCCLERKPVNPVVITTSTTPKPKTKRTQKTTRSPKPTSTKTSSIVSRIAGDMSKKKCKEYAKYAYSREESPVLSLFPTFSNILECAFEKEELIVGGTKASRQEFPHMVQIGYGDDNDIIWACGGALISEKYVLTAGHCLSNRELKQARHVRAGITNLTDNTHKQQRIVADVIAHPLYSNKKYHDIGLLRLQKKFDLDTWVRPACLHTEKNLPYAKALASGWGKIDFAGDDSKDLLKVKLEIFPVDKCNQTYRRDIIQIDSPLKDGIIDDLMICAGSSTENKDTCQGDSGGPLQYYVDDTDEIKCMYGIIGVTSFGKSCGLALNVPGVYTRVSHYIKWIEDTVWP